MQTQLLEDIAEYCRRVGVAESTFGRRVVNDGKPVPRPRQGGRLATDTLDRIRSFLRGATSHEGAAQPMIYGASAPLSSMPAIAPASPANTKFDVGPAPSSGVDPQQNFRFFDNRQKYLLFVHTC